MQKSTLILCLCSSLVWGCASEEEPSFMPWDQAQKSQDISLQDAIANSFVLKNFEALIVTSGLASETNSPPYTMFMPWDNAFKSLPPYWRKMTRGRSWRAHLRDIAEAHIHEGLVPASQLEGETLVMMNGDTANFTVENSRRALDGIRVIANVAATDGHAYMLQDVRLPSWTDRTVADIVDTDPRFAALRGALTSEQRDHLRSADSVTLFAPTNVALCRDPSDPSCSDRREMDAGDYMVDQVLPHMFTPDNAFTARSGATLTWTVHTESGVRTVTCSVEDSGMLPTVPVGAQQELATNGIVHPIDTLLCSLDGDSGFMCDIECADGESLSDTCEASVMTADEAACDAQRQACCIEDDPNFTCDIVCATGSSLSDSCEPSLVTENEAECENRRQECCVEDDVGFACDINCGPGTVLSNVCEPSLITADAAECEARTETCCVQDVPDFMCDITCQAGTTLATSCQASFVTEDEAQCDAETAACCVDLSGPCAGFCSPWQRFLPDATLRGRSCQDILGDLEASDYECGTPGIDLTYACCENTLPPPPTPASEPCYDFCSEGTQLVGSRVIAGTGATCWEHTQSIPANDTQCTQPDPEVHNVCCEQGLPEPVRTNRQCCMCGNCSLPVAERRNLTIGSNGLDCLTQDFRMIVDMEAGTDECDARQSAFQATCCDPDFEPPPPVPGAQDTPVPPCEGPNPPGYCDGPHPSCDLCRDGRYPGNPYTITAIAYISGNPSCDDLYWMGREGALPQAFCYPIQNFMEEPCGCR